MNKELDFVKEMFDRIAPRYDFLNRLLSLRQDVMWREQMVRAAAPAKESRVLDAACGTCDVALAVSRHLKGRTRVTGLDFSFAMLREGQHKLADQTIGLVNADALNLPFASATFDTVFIAFGIRNIMDRRRALSEFHRVLDRGGRLAVLELTTPENPFFKTVYLTYFKKILPVVGGLFSKNFHAYRYLPASVLQFPSPAGFAGLMSAAGFSRVRFRPMTLGIVTLFVGTKK